MNKKLLCCATLFLLFPASRIAGSEHSVARLWNEALLEAIRDDFARPTVHARNLFHTSIAMYDAWAVFDDRATTYLLAKTVDGFTCTFEGVDTPADRRTAREEAISYAAYRLLRHRFQNSPGAAESLVRFDSLLADLGYDTSITSTDYQNGPAAALGNYIAKCLIDFGQQDRSNEQNDYSSLSYEPINPPLVPILPGNPDIVYPNRWQPLTLEVFIDQSGNVIPFNTPEFLSPEWGQVTAFALTETDRTVYQRNGFDYWVYHDPGAPPHIDLLDEFSIDQEYMWGFALVAIWSAHLGLTDDRMWDISPATIGNMDIRAFPQTIEELREFYNLLEGGDPSMGHSVNPRTGQPYEPQFVPRGDYARVLAEFWADGPDSETPPGHWFTILNYVNDHVEFKKRFRGEGPIVDDLEWDVKAYFALGGAVHDAAVAAWGIKGWYDYVRPISAIRSMADRGQSSDPAGPSYSPHGLPLEAGFIEVVEEGDPLAGAAGENIGKIKLYTWRGPNFINDPETDVAGVGWILAENWWPYQRPSFVTPPFAGYVSGHSTFSRAAAEVLTLLTGDEYFPGGLGEFYCPKNEFLVFEDGPSVDVTLQWATYRDAADQCSLSRIWGGIHPPADDIPGRLIGEKIGTDAFLLAERYFTGHVTSVEHTPSREIAASIKIYPNPVRSGETLTLALTLSPSELVLSLYNILGQVVQTQTVITSERPQQITMSTNGMGSGFYFLRVAGNNWTSSHRIVIIK
ncbi:T9SS type A sorting domain-containing protein [bacterium]|nr:T9SS type A sorting domain-containing protein [bacterium]